MIKIKKYVPGILVVMLAFSSFHSLAKPQKRTKKPSRSRTELPEVLNRTEQLSIRKLHAQDDSVVFKPLEYRYEPIQLTQDTLKNKGITTPREKSRPSFFEYQLGCGNFRQFNVDFTTWQKFEKTEFRIRAYHHRNEGEFDNNRFRTAIFSGNVSHRINPQFRINSNLAYSFQNYQLQAAPQPQTERKQQNFQFSGKLPIQSSAKNITVFHGKFEHFGLTEQAPEFKSPFENSENTLSLAGKFFHRFSKSVFIFDVNFFHNSLSFLPDSSISDFISKVKTQYVYRFNSNFSFVTGLTLTNISFNEEKAESRLLPYGKIVFAQKDRWGLYLTAAQKLEYQTFNSLWKQNPFLAQSAQLNIQESEYALKAALEIMPHPALQFNLTAKQDKIVNAGYFQKENYLYNYYTVPEATQTTITPGLVIKIHPTLKAQWKAIISHFKFDSTTSTAGNNHLPHTENFSTELLLNYEIPAYGKLELATRFIDKRYPGFEKTNKIDPVILVNLSYEKKYNEYVTLYAQIKNIFNQDYFIWEGYREPGIYFLAGVEGKW